MATLKFENGSLRLYDSDERMVLNQSFRPGDSDESKRPWVDRDEAIAYWNSSLASTYGWADSEGLTIEE